jgi:hypothetical protein
MRILIIYLSLLLIALPSCSRQSNGTSTVVKPKNHHRFYDPKKDKRTKRTRVVKMKN